MDICSCYEKRQEHVCNGICNGTRECDECQCGGDPTKCDFYPEKREKALKEKKDRLRIKQYHSQLAECVKIAGQMMIDQAEDIVGIDGHISDLTVCVNFDPSFKSIPELVVTRSHLPDKEKLDKIMEIYETEVITKKEEETDE